MKLYVLRELTPFAWDSPVGIFSEKAFALVEAKRLAELKLKMFKNYCKKDAIKRRFQKPEDFFMESTDETDRREEGFGVYRKNWKIGRKEIMSTPLEVMYHVEEFELDKRAHPLFPGA